jgi:hypothetical protein
MMEGEEMDNAAVKYDPQPWDCDRQASLCTYCCSYAKGVANFSQKCLRCRLNYYEERLRGKSVDVRQRPIWICKTAV